jgi:CheY-like chemotaxis protein
MARILIIDESAAFRRLLRFVLKGHAIVEARFGLEAIKSLSKGPFSLVICDAHLPDMEPDEFYRRLTEEGGYYGRLLFLASQLDIMPRDSFERRLPVLYKPVDAEVLVNRVEEMLVLDATQWDVK